MKLRRKLNHVSLLQQCSFEGRHLVYKVLGSKKKKEKFGSGGGN